MIDVAYGNGIWVVSHNGNSNSLAYSYNGTQWTGLGTTVGASYISITLKFSGNKFYAFPSSGVNTIFTSTNGTIWTGLGTTISPTIPSNISTILEGNNNSLVYSYDGINWSGLGSSIFTTAGYGISWNGNIFVATGQGTNTLAYSQNGINWTGIGSTIFSTTGSGSTTGVDV